MRRGRFGVGFGFAGGEFAFQAETDAWETAVVGDGGTVSAGRKNLVNSLIVGLKGDGIWTKLDRLWIFAAENSQSALRDLVGANAATLVNAPTFAADDGYTGNGTNSNIDTGFDPTTAPSPKFVQNSASIFAWSNTSGGQAGWIIGQNNPGNVLWPNFGDGNFYGSVNGADNEAVANAGAVGLYSGNRSAADSQEFYLNGASLAVDVQASVTPHNSTIKICGHTGAFSTRQICCGGFGQSLTSTEHDALYDRLRTYMTAVGVP